MICQCLKRILFISILTGFCICCCCSNSTNKKVDIKGIDGKIILYGYELKTKHAVKISNPHVSTDTLISTDLSPNNDNLIVTVGNPFKGYREWEFWFYDKSKKGEPIKIIPSNLPIKDVGVKWLSNDIFQIEWGGFGWEQSRFYDARNMNNNFLCDDCRFYDVTKDVYVAQRESKIEIGPGFYKNNYKTESFDLGLPPNMDVLDVISSIKDVKIENTSLVVFCDRGKGVMEKLVFHPLILILKEKKSSSR
jgi:hypothetical protein